MISRRETLARVAPALVRRLTGPDTGALVFDTNGALVAAPDAPDQASALNASAFNIGIGGGSLMGGALLDQWGAGRAIMLRLVGVLHIP